MCSRVEASFPAGQVWRITSGRRSRTGRLSFGMYTKGAGRPRNGDWVTTRRADTAGWGPGGAPGAPWGGGGGGGGRGGRGGRGGGVRPGGGGGRLFFFVLRLFFFPRALPRGPLPPPHRGGPPPLPPAGRPPLVHALLHPRHPAEP